MINELVSRWEVNKHIIKEEFSKKHPDSYNDVVTAVIKHITTDAYEEYALDPERIHEIDDGDYQGCLLYVIAEKGYQPHDYWYVKVSYGSCSGCDTLQSIQRYDTEEIPTEDQVKDYMTLALHIVQGIKSMNGCEVDLI